MNRTPTGWRGLRDYGGVMRLLLGALPGASALLAVAAGGGSFGGRGLALRGEAAETTERRGGWIFMHKLPSNKFASGPVDGFSESPAGCLPGPPARLPGVMELGYIFEAKLRAGIGDRVACDFFRYLRSSGVSSNRGSDDEGSKRSRSLSAEHSLLPVIAPSSRPSEQVGNCGINRSHCFLLSPSAGLAFGRHPDLTVSVSYSAVGLSREKCRLLAIGEA